MNFVFEWPQIVYSSVMALSIIAYAILDGKKRSGTYSFGWALVSYMLQSYILYVGGFFTEVRP